MSDLPADRPSPVEEERRSLAFALLREAIRLARDARSRLDQLIRRGGRDPLP